MHNKGENELYNKKAYQEDWIKLLCSFGDTEEYQGIRDKSKSDVFAIMKYRKVLRHKLGSIPLSKLQKAYVKNDNYQLHKLLEQLYLEPIAKEQYTFILDKIYNKENVIENLYERHLQNPNERIMTSILTI